MNIWPHSLKCRNSLSVALAALAFTGPVRAETSVTRILSQSIAVPVGTNIRVENLVGHMTVTQSNGSLQITATVVASGNQAQALSQSVGLDVQTSGNQVIVHVHYPLDQYSSYLYNPKNEKYTGRNSHCFMFCNGWGSNTDIKYQGTHVAVYQHRNQGAPLYVNVVVQLPAGAETALVNPIGRVDATNLANDLTVNTYGADVYAMNLTGGLYADTGSGDVHMQGLKGNFKADTGSGEVYADQLTGDVRVDTSSGDVHVSNATSRTLDADTGSGDVIFDHVKGDMRLDTGSGDVRIKDASGSLHADTGSGEVNAENYTSGASVWADTGSGDVRLSGDLSAIRNLYIDTSSGGVVLKTSAGLSMHLVASSDSGEVSVNLPGLSNVAVKNGYFSGDFGKAEGQGILSTDSGDIVVSQE